jgi:hypothetical protein
MLPLHAGSEVYTNFKVYLEKRLVVEHLDIYSMIEKVEGGSHWSPEEVKFACDGLCSKYLGVGDEPELIPVDEIVLENIKERLASPSIGMFKELKRAVAQTLEEHYANFVDTGGVATDLRKGNMTARKDSPVKEAQSLSRTISAPKFGDKPRQPSKFGLHVSANASPNKRNTVDSDEKK